MYKPYSHISEKTKNDLLKVANSIDWKINKGPEVDYKTYSDVISKIKGIKLPWLEVFWYKAMFICIPSGGLIKRHSDGFSIDRDCKGPHTKYHIALQTNDKCINYSWGDIEQKIHLEENSVYSFDALPEHASFNYGDTDRIHLVIDIYEH